MMYFVYYDENGDVTGFVTSQTHMPAPAVEVSLEEYKELTGTTPSEPTPSPPTDLERLRADMDFIAIMTGVEL